MAPSLNTAEAFWKIVIQNKVNLIIQLCPDEENDKEMCVNYYDPTKTLETDFLKFGDVTVRLSQKKEKFTGLFIRKLQISLQTEDGQIT